MSIDEITKDKNLMRIIWLTLSLTTQIKEDELMKALLYLLEDYFIKHDKEWLEKWITAAEEFAESGKSAALHELMTEATSIGKMIMLLEEDPTFKESLH